MSSSSFLTSLLGYVATSLLAVFTAFGLELTSAQTSALLGLIGDIGFIATYILWTRTVPKEKVLEHLVGADTVIAGPANDFVSEGDVVRHIEPKHAE